MPDHIRKLAYSIRELAQMSGLGRSLFMKK